MNKLLIERYSTPHFKSYIEITPTNKNYVVFNKIDEVLRKEKKSWYWFIKRLDVPITTFNTYFSGKENVSLKTIERMSNILKPYIESPRDIMNANFPLLALGKEFRLNIGFILIKYGITQGEVARYTSIDRGAVSLIVRDKMKCLNPNSLLELFYFLKNRGVPVNCLFDLIYFPTWGEQPDHFVRKTKVTISVFKFHSSYRRI